MAARRVAGVQIERAADEILAVRPGISEAHALNQSAAVVFDLCDGKTSKSEMAAEVQRRTGLPANEEIVDLALAELADAGLVTLDSAESRPTATRRSLIRRFSLSAAAIAMLPVVETILAPPASAHGPAPTPAPHFAPIPPVPAPVPVPAPTHAPTTPTPTPTPVPD
jgi:Coenzyme PQQ synthesis protein D (PqqD)